MSLKEWKGVEADAEQLLKVEPKHKKAQEMLNQAREEIAKSLKAKPKKGRRVQIEEVDDVTETSIPTPKAIPTSVKVNYSAPMPQEVVEWKEKGNDLFRRGQYGEAVSIYTKAIEKLENGIYVHGTVSAIPKFYNSYSHGKDPMYKCTECLLCYSISWRR